MHMYGGVTGYTNGYVKISNCYNKAKVTVGTIDNVRIGGILGKIEGNGTVTVTNCSTTTKTAIGVNDGISSNQTITNVEAGQTNLPSVLSVINTDNDGVFIEDNQNINNGYPILKWQKDNKK